MRASDHLILLRLAFCVFFAAALSCSDDSSEGSQPTEPSPDIGQPDADLEENCNGQPFECMQGCINDHAGLAICRDGRWTCDFDDWTQTICDCNLNDPDVIFGTYPGDKCDPDRGFVCDPTAADLESCPRDMCSIGVGFYSPRHSTDTCDCSYGLQAIECRKK